MGNPWDPERTVSTALAQFLITSQFPALAPLRVEPLGVGWDNSAFLVNGDLVFRFPRRQIAVELLETELRVLPHVGRRVPLAIPTPEWSGQAEPRFPWPFAGYRWLPGRPASNVRLDDRERLQMARPLAGFLSALHGVRLEEAKRWGAGPDTIGRLDAGRLGAQARLALDGLCERGSIASQQPWIDIIDAATETQPAGRLTLVHGDLYSRHLLVNDSHELTGVIDFGDVHYGDPAVDLSVAWGMLPPAARDTFFTSYGGADERTRRLARLRALTSAVALEAFGRDTGDAELVTEGLRALHCLAEE